MGSLTDSPTPLLLRDCIETPAAPQLTLAVVVPAFHEAATLRDVIVRVLRQVDRVIIVDDGSVDGTAATVCDLPVTLLCNPVNLGKAASLRRGIMCALTDGASAVVTLDADGQHAPEDIPRLVAAHLQEPQVIIVGARLHDKHKIPRARYFANRFGSFLVAWAAGYPIADSQSGFRLYPASILAALDIGNDTTQGFVFESAVLINAARAGYISTPVNISAIYHSGARPSHFRPIRDIFLIGRMIWWSILSRGFNIRGLIRSRRSAAPASHSHLA
jgi:glycosyltransferase involved in cell wall biosynthesis